MSKSWFTDGSRNIIVKDGEPIQEGFYKGRTVKHYLIYKLNIKEESLLESWYLQIPDSDMGKFSGDVYIKLEFILKSSNNPSKHWYCPTTEKRNHITDNFFRQRGYDQIFNEHYDRCTSN